MHIHLKIVFKWADHFNVLTALQMFQAAINTATLRASFLSSASPPVRHTHF